MGQTDGQFKAFLRFVLDDLRDIRAEKDEKKRNEQLDKVIANMQQSLED